MDKAAHIPGVSGHSALLLGAADDKLPTNSYAFWAAGFNARLSVDVMSLQGIYSTSEDRSVAMSSGRIIWYQLPVEMWA